jgi:hypothetical protein
VADIGSGDGKYFGINPDIFSIGCDRSLKLLQVRIFITNPNSNSNANPNPNPKQSFMYPLLRNSKVSVVMQ